MKRYNPKDIEPMWQKTWAEQGLYNAIDFDTKPKYVMLTEFPYPSGDGLHLGHIREYTYGDIMARQKRMQGHNVLYPMGYDAFGLPTENYAIKNKITPQSATDTNVANFQKQFESLGYSFDWSRAFRTTDPAYYKWTQWLFLQFFKAGLAYQDETAINWCPHCKTGLSNEEVVNGRHERCDTIVEKKLLKQWLLKITDYADRLIDGLNDIDFPSRIADQQINWIGRSTGAEVDFQIDDSVDKLTIFTTRIDTIYGATFLVLAPEHPLVQKIVSADHKAETNSYITAVQAKSEVERQDVSRDKTGVFTGAYARNPATGKKIPIWIADYVLMGYGTGAIMAVPAHDERDFDFAKKYNLPVKNVLTPDFTSRSHGLDDKSQAVDRPAAIAVAHDPATDKYCLIDWPKAHHRAGLEWPGGGMEPNESIEQAALREFAEETGYTDAKVEEVMPAAISFYYRDDETDDPTRTIKNIVKLSVNSQKRNEEFTGEDYEKDAYEVRWLSRQEIMDNLNYMDESFQAITHFAFNQPIHIGEGVMINSGKYDNLPSAEAREQIVADLVAAGQASEKINYRLRDWIFSRQRYWGEPIPIIHCPEHGAVAVPEDQLPVELPPLDDYEPTDDGQSPLSRAKDWLNVDCPVCGQAAKRETDTMPNWAGSSWYYLRYFDAHNDQVFADRQKLDYWGEVDLYLGGMEHTTLHLLYSRFWHEFFYDQGLVPTPEPYAARRGQGIILAADGSKMSKSKGNVVNPTDIIDSGYGADALRLAISFLAPYDQTTPWSPEGVAGTHRFLQRIWTLTQEFLATEKASSESDDLKRAVNKAIKKVSDDLVNMNFNTAIAALMETANELYRIKAADKYASADWQWALENILLLLAPFAPHISEELWRQLGHQTSIHTTNWPTYDDKYLVQNELMIAVQINGKLRGEIRVAADASEAIVTASAKKLEKVAGYLQGQNIKKTIYVPGRLVNFVI
jgi:leucyl-tRNA synthetase